MNLGTASVIRANSRHLPLADNSVDLVVTSPPYFALRSYQDGGEHYAGQIGDEPTPAEFVDSLLEVTAECVRVLKPSGSLWVNLGDKYAQAEERSRNGNGNRKAIDNFTSGSVLGKSCNRCGASAPQDPCPYSDVPCGPRFTREKTVTLGRKDNGGVPRKSLIGIPWRYALRCIDDLGLILRAEVIWSKPNGLPESVTDRVRRSHEVWFHFTLSPRYFSAVDEIREQYDAPQKPRGQAPNGANPATGGIPTSHDRSPLGKLPGSVWTVPTEPLRVPDHLGVDHFAAFPTEWPKRIIAGWSPAGVCVECGEGRRPVVEKALEHVNFTSHAKTSRGKALDARVRTGSEGVVARGSATIIGHACACGHFGPNDCASCGEPATTAVSHNGTSIPVCLRHYNHWRTPTTPAVVLDPFGGTGTTAMVAKALGRHGISVDMSADYCRLAEWRTNDRDQLAKVLGIAKADGPTQDESLFDLLDGEAS